MAKKLAITCPIVLGVPLLVILGLLALAGEAPADVGALLAQADAYVAEGRYAEAETAYLQVVAAAAPGAEPAFGARKGLVRVYLTAEAPAQAQANLKAMLLDFADHERLPHTVHEIAEQACRSGQGPPVQQLYAASLQDVGLAGQRIWLVMGLAVCDAYLGNDAAVATAVEGLISQFYDDRRVVDALGQIAWSYRKLDRHRQAREIYQFVVDTWPHGYRAVMSLRGMALCDIAEGRYDRARKAAARLMDPEYRSDAHLAEALYALAEAFRNGGHPKDSLKMYQYIVDFYPQDRQAIGAYRGLALSQLAAGDEASAQRVAETLLSDFADHPDLGKALYQIAGKMRSAALARGLYEHVATSGGNPELALQSLAKVGCTYLREGQLEVAQSVLDGLLTEFAGDPALPKAVAVMADGYYIEALALDNKDLAEDAVWFYEKAIAECRRVLEQMPEVPFTTAEACYYIAVCNERMGRRAEAIPYYQQVVRRWPDFRYAWYAQYLIGHNHEQLVKQGLLPAQEAKPAIEAAYTQLLERYPDCKVSGYARRRLGLTTPVVKETTDETQRSRSRGGSGDHSSPTGR